MAKLTIEQLEEAAKLYNPDGKLEYYKGRPIITQAMAEHLDCPYTSEDKPVRMFADKIDFECEMGRAAGGTTVYKSVEDLKANSRHDVSECGIVEIEIKLVRVVEEPKALTPERIKELKDAQRKRDSSREDKREV